MCGTPSNRFTFDALRSEFDCYLSGDLPPQRNATLSAFKFLRNVYLCYFSKPVGNRALYKQLRKKPVHSIVEIGIGRLQRTKVLLEIALQATPAEALKYTGVDLFEARTDAQTGVGLKQAHKDLKPLGVKVQLVPGDAFSGLARSANSLTKTDLLILSADLDADALAKAWFYVPRMLHEDSSVFVEQAGDKPGETTYRLLTRLEIEKLASSAARSMRRAA